MEKKFNTKRLDTEWLSTGEKDMYDNDIYLGDMIIFTSNVDNREYVGTVMLFRGFLIAYNPGLPDMIHEFEQGINFKTLRIVEANLIKRKLNRRTK